MVTTATNTGSTLLRSDGLNKTSVGISTNVIIKVGPNTVGAIQELSVNEARNIRMIDEVGTDGHIDSVPTSSTNITGSCNRIRFERMRVAEAFSRPFLHVHAQRYPFDIVMIDQWNGEGDNAIITTIKNVWIRSIGYSVGATDWIITDRMDWEAEAIYSTLANGNAATGGERGIPLALGSPTSDIERDADVGGRRGALDAPGLLQAFLPY